VHESDLRPTTVQFWSSASLLPILIGTFSFSLQELFQIITQSDKPGLSCRGTQAGPSSPASIPPSKPLPMLPPSPPQRVPPTFCKWVNFPALDPIFPPFFVLVPPYKIARTVSSHWFAQARGMYDSLFGTRLPSDAGNHLFFSLVLVSLFSVGLGKDCHQCRLSTGRLPFVSSRLFSMITLS